MQKYLQKSWLQQKLLPCLLAVAAAFAARYQLELSDGVGAAQRAAQWPLWAPLNALTALCLTLALYALLGRWARATLGAGAALTVLAVANYYTRDLHGTALMPQDVRNLGTAAEVLGSYTLHITPTVAGILALFALVLALVWLQTRLERPLPRRVGWRARAVRAGGAAAGIFAVLFFGYFSPWPLKPAATYGWAWQETYYKYGYLAGTVEASSLLVDPILMPAGYSDEAAAEAAARADGYRRAVPVVDPGQYPDLLLVLSESWYDFRLVTDPQADVDFMANYEALPNAVRGHTVSPHVGGGTNSSEYEMLTGNSLMLMPSITPFNWLDLHDANSLVRYLESLGYATMAAHPYTNSNYRRDAAWRALGFDETHFLDDFPSADYYGQRPYQNDAATYADWLALYEAMPADRPRFAFLVSIQSHGDYDLNPPELDLVHAATNFGGYDAQMDEYLSCVYLTDQALPQLTEALRTLYETSGRRVVLAIAGDHAPSFVDHVADHSLAAANDLQILERSTPFLIWANYPLPAAVAGQPEPYSRIDLCDLGALMAEQAGLPLTAFQRYLLAMRGTVALQTAGNDYMTAAGVTGVYGQDPAADDWLHGYFYLEYNNIGAHARRAQALFDLP